MEVYKQVSQVCMLDLIHLQRVSFSSLAWQSSESETDKDLNRSYFKWFKSTRKKQPKQNYLLAALYSSGHPFYFRTAYVSSKEGETLVVTANLSKDPCHVTQKLAESQVWKPEWPEANELQVGLLCLLAEKGKLLILLDPCSVLLRIYSLETRELYCCIHANDIQWKDNVVIAMTAIHLGDTLNILLLSNSLKVYCISVFRKDSDKEKQLSSVSMQFTFLII